MVMTVTLSNTVDLRVSLNEKCSLVCFLNDDVRLIYFTSIFLHFDFDPKLRNFSGV